MTARPLAALLVLACCAACGGDGNESAADTAPTTTTTGGQTTVATESGCEHVEAPKPKPDGGQTPPNTTLKAPADLVFATNCGSFTVRLDPKLAPHTGASLVKLAKNGFYDETIFHRIVRRFVIQGGDPLGRGTGGPGYSTVDKPPADSRYTKGVVAMAKAAAEPAGTSGSQFFVVTGEDVGLPPDYAIVGKVTHGLDVVERIGKLGNDLEQPTQTVLIRKVTVEE
jgi:cyclophilin family peptidyl-prolyl cis-trans isomerase